MDRSYLVNDPAIDHIKLAVPKMFADRWDVKPFIVLYAFMIASYYLSSDETVQLVGYWYIPFRLWLAYDELSIDTISSILSKYDSKLYREAITEAQYKYESSLTYYSFSYKVWAKKAVAYKNNHQAMVKRYNPASGLPPPPPYVPLEPPKIPQRGAPPVLINHQHLTVCLFPAKHHGSPSLCPVYFDNGDDTRIKYTITGGPTPEIAQTSQMPDTQFSIQLSGQQQYPPLWFLNHHFKYITDPITLHSNIDKIKSHNTPLFTSLQFPDHNLLSSYLDGWVNSIQCRTLLTYYGLNSLYVPIPSFISLFLENAMSPFFVFQLICVLLWCLDEYWYYSLFTLAMIVGLECTVVWKRQGTLQQNLAEKPPQPHLYTYRPQNDNITYKDSNWVLTSTKQLVPGDLVALPVYTDSSQIDAIYGTKNEPNEALVDCGRPSLFTLDIPCDMVLLSGSCVCDEAMLTGESIPQLKEDIMSLSTVVYPSLSDKSNRITTTTTTTTRQKKNTKDSDGDDDDDDDDNDTTTTTTTTTTSCDGGNPDDDDELQTLYLDTNQHKKHLLLSGARLIGVQRPMHVSLDRSWSNEPFALSVPYPSQYDRINVRAVLCRVVRTGFATTQGSTVRTILTASQLNLVDYEALMFIGCLLACALVSAYFVLIEGLSDPTRSRYKLMLNVITILTSVVPPELPMELTLAVNNALASLAKFQVFCTEPSKIPDAGKIDVCCFDKTGTLTADTFLLTDIISYHNIGSNHTTSNKQEEQQQFISLSLTQRPSTDSDTHTVVSTNNDTDEESLGQSYDCTSLPIDIRLIMGAAQELTCIQSQRSSSNNTTSNDNKKGGKIIGDPMESVAFHSAGFRFTQQQQQQQQGVTTSSKRHTSKNVTQLDNYGVVYCDASPVNIHTSSSSSRHEYEPIPQATKERVEAYVIHRFGFQSQAQRMSTVVAVNAKTSSYDSSSSSPQQWLNDTLPTPQLRLAARNTCIRVLLKGSPERVYSLLHPDYRPDLLQYTEKHKSLARQGVRVLAMAWKPLYVDNNGLVHDIPLDDDNTTTNSSLRGLKDIAAVTKANIKLPHRDICENNMFFAGIIGFSSANKAGTKLALEQLQASNHQTIMITGDHILTAIAVGKDLGMCSSNSLLLMTSETALLLQDKDILANNHDIYTLAHSKNTLVWVNTMEQIVKPFTPDDVMFKQINDSYITAQKIATHTTTNQTASHNINNPSLCISGDIFDILHHKYSTYMPYIVSACTIFARTLPFQKELILKYLRDNNKITLMCGDGTNDVGALTTAHIGIALLSQDTDTKEQLDEVNAKLKEMRKNPAIRNLLDRSQKLREVGFISQAEDFERQAHAAYRRLQQMNIGGIFDNTDNGDDENDGIPKLGDASLAASFSAKHGSIRCVVDVIRQGRCALSTTGQMYQILALQCLTAAYSLSALYFQGVRQSESQMTIGGMANAILFMLLSRAQPLDKISPQRPNSRIFSMYNITTIILQFIVHLSILVYMVQQSLLYTPHELISQSKLEGATYVPSVLNSTVFLLSTAMTATTILANYVGYPHMTPLTTTMLFRIIIAVLLGCVVLSLEYMPDLNEMMEMAPMPSVDYATTLATAIILDCVLTVSISIGCKLLFGINTLNMLLYGNQDGKAKKNNKSTSLSHNNNPSQIPSIQGQIQSSSSSGSGTIQPKTNKNTTKNNTKRKAD